MPLHKFGKNDILHNQIKTHPSSSFFIYDSSIYYNNKASEPGQFAANVPNASTGYVNLLEMNVDRAAVTNSSITIGPSSSVSSSQNVLDTGLIYPFVYKGLSKMAFRDMSRMKFVHRYNNGDVLSGSYQMSASISRQRYTSAYLSIISGSSLKNSLSYAKRLGEHYDVDDASGINVIQIPSIFYGSEIKKGTVDLKYHMTGNVVGRLRDTRQNGALVMSEGTEASAHDGEIAGVVLYKEGFILLTGSWALASVFTNATKIEDKDVHGALITGTNASWLNFGFGANDKVGSGANTTNGSASFSVDFVGTHKVPTMTMLAHANKGELNYSNNPTYVSASQANVYTPLTGTHLYREKELVIKNIHSSSYADPSGSLVKTTYITKIGIYDRRKKLIGIASLAKPVKKTEDRDLTFKLKLDI